MKCANCGAELQVGSVYCSVCGEEAQIVSDYSILEDDLLREMLNGEGEGSNLLQKSMRRDRSQGENLNGKDRTAISGEGKILQRLGSPREPGI